MSPVGSTKRVIDIDITKLAQFFSKYQVAIFFFLVEAEVFKQQNVASFQQVGCFLCRLPDAIRGKKYFVLISHEFLQVRNQVGKGIFVGWTILWSSQVAHKNN